MLGAGWYLIRDTSMCERNDSAAIPYSVTGVPVRLAAPIGGRSVRDGTGQPLRA
jgi:hypothetical protein